MMYKLRNYQQRAVDAAVNHLQSNSLDNGLVILPTGSGKSLVIANIALRINAPVLVLQPSQEILIQNYNKMHSYNVECSMYSASVNSKVISRITFATIGSIMARYLDFFKFRYVIIDECHLVNPKDGMYKRFLTASRCRMIGLTATPYRLQTDRVAGSMLNFLTNIRPQMFHKVLDIVQVRELAEQGFLAPTEYYSCPLIDTRRLTLNIEEYTDTSVKAEYKRTNFNESLVGIIQRLMKVDRKHILVFTRYVEEAQNAAETLGECAAFISGATSSKERADTLQGFINGRIRVLLNVGTLTTGFDFPALDTVVLARPTRSLSLYYQIVGRAIRPYEGKTSWFVDLCGTYDHFGKVEDLEIRQDKPLQYAVHNKERKLTNVYLQ